MYKRKLTKGALIEKYICEIVIPMSSLMTVILLSLTMFGVMPEPWFIIPMLILVSAFGFLTCVVVHIGRRMY
jgi:hypothetical protein